MKMNQSQILEFINTLKGYQGYIQMSDKPISDIWKTFSDISFAPKSGFVYEAHFCNGVESIAIKQINDTWLVSTTNISKITDSDDTQSYHTIHGHKVKMAQIWEPENDKLCENMPVMKLKKVVFARFTKGDNQ